MPAIPNVLLKQLYVKDSLRTGDQGWAFELANRLGAGTVTAFERLALDGTDVPMSQVEIEMCGGSRRPINDTSPAAPLSLPAGVSLTVHVRGAPLAAGKHRLDVAFHTQELGPLALHVTDTARHQPAVNTPSLISNPQSPIPNPQSPIPNPHSPLSHTAAVRVAILGAGSTVFARQLMTDLLCVEGLTGTFALVDVDAERLELAHAIGQKLVEAAGGGWTVEATADRARALPGCDYVLNMIEVAGLRNVAPDYEIPRKYGVDQCIGDTIGPGGIFKMLRTGPAWLDIVRDAERLCPHAVVMNYTNPMSALTLLALRATGLELVGLCHSVQGTSRDLAGYLEVPYEELRFRCAGINHLAWFVELTHQGQNLYPRLREAARDPEIYECDPVRFEMMLHFGAFVTESSGHLSEYLPYFRKRPDLVARYTREGYRGESGFYAHNWPRWRREAQESVRAQLEGRSEIVLHRSSEYASFIVEAIEKSQPTVIHGNVLNAGLIDNLPAGGCVEVPVLVDGTGLHPTHFGPLPPQMAALDAAHMYVHELMVEAVVNRDRQAALHALLLDPLTAAVLAPTEIKAMFDEMWEAEREDIGY